MIATEELRAMLDERGVEWGTGLGSIIEWAGENGRICRAFERNEPLTVDVEMLAVTPTQAVEATLGRGTCRNVDESEGHFECSACGFTFSSWGGFGCDCGDEPDFRFCPECGAKVVD